MEPKDAMRPAESSSRFTWEDLSAFPQDGKRREIIDGELYVTPSPSLRHQDLSMRLTRILLLYLEAHPIGRLFAAPLDVIFSDFDVVEPDLLFVSHERGEILQDWVRGSPDLCVEILSPTTRRTDELIKRRLYERTDVREYWIVDPELESLKVYRRTEAGLPRVAELSAENHDTLTTPLLPGLFVRLDELFG
jgi:Uma2 family endonuclease